jgi:hypothetical protein
MDDIGVVQVEQCLAYLVDYIFFVLLVQDVAFPDDREQVDVHMLEHEIDVGVIVSFDDLLQLDDIGVRQLVKKGDLSVNALRIGGVGEGIKIFL